MLSRRGPSCLTSLPLHSLRLSTGQTEFDVGIGEVNNLARRMIVHYRLLVRAIGYPEDSHLIILKLNLIVFRIYFDGVLSQGLANGS